MRIYIPMCDNNRLNLLKECFGKISIEVSMCNGYIFINDEYGILCVTEEFVSILY